MKTIVAKGSDYSVSEIRYMQNSKNNDINLCLVYPSGIVSNLQTSSSKLVFLTEDESSLIYYDQEIADLMNNKSKSLDPFDHLEVGMTDIDTGIM